MIRFLWHLFAARRALRRLERQYEALWDRALANHVVATRLAAQEDRCHEEAAQTTQ